MLKFQIEYIYIIIIIIIICLIILLSIGFILYKFHCLKLKTTTRKINDYESVLNEQHQQEQQKIHNNNNNSLINLVEINFINFLIILNKKLNINNRNRDQNQNQNSERICISKSTSTTTLEIKKSDKNTNSYASVAAAAASAATSATYCPNEYKEIRPDNNQNNQNNYYSSSNFNYNNNKDIININNNSSSISSTSSSNMNKYGTTTTTSNNNNNNNNIIIDINSINNDSENKEGVLSDRITNKIMFKFDFITNIKNILKSPVANISGGGGSGKDVEKIALNNIVDAGGGEVNDEAHHQQLKIKNKFLKQQQDTPSSFKYRASESSTVSSLSPRGIRRYSIIEENISDKFWVPEEIAKNSQQRCSLPTTYPPYGETSEHLNDAFINDSDRSINSMEHNRSMFDRRESIPISSNGSSSIITSNSILNNNGGGGGGGGLRRASTVTSSSKGRRASMFDPIDPTELQKTLYQSQINRDSLASIDATTSATSASTSSPSGTTAIDCVGMLEIGLEYADNKLKVEIIRCFDLQPKDFSDIADPFCKCILMPDKISQQTKVSRKTLNPVFEETFEFDVEQREHLDNRVLVLEVYDFDKFTKNECIGYTRIPLNNVNLETKKILLKELKPSIKITEEEEDIGDLMFSLAYLPGAERLTIVIMKARNLKGLGVTKKTPPDPFVKLCLQTKDGKKHKKKKTSTQKYTMNPVYNEEVVFTNITKEQLLELDIKLMIFHDSMTSRELLGYVELNSASKGNEYEHWKDMIDGKKSTGWWHQLHTYPYVHKNSISNVLSHYNYFHHHHHHHHNEKQQAQQQQQQQHSYQQQQSSNDDIEDVCDNNSPIKNLNEASLAIASLVLASTPSNLTLLSQQHTQSAVSSPSKTTTNR